MSNYHPTAINRKELSMPMRTIIKNKIIKKGDLILDFGCGRSDDVKFLQRQLKHRAYGYDPNLPDDLTHFLVNDISKLPYRSFDIVTCIYVLNVVENEEERKEIVKQLLSLSKNKIIIAIRADKNIKGRPHKDGVITRRNTFQMNYSPQNIQSFLISVLSEAGYSDFSIGFIKKSIIQITKES
jgi:DNA phosphorothioation-associated putative methyltransferase